MNGPGATSENASGFAGIGLPVHEGGAERGAIHTAPAAGRGAPFETPAEPGAESEGRPHRVLVSAAGGDDPQRIAKHSVTVADELVDHYLTGDAELGLRSSWGALTGMALGGAGGSPDPERIVTDRRFGLGPGGTRRSLVQHAREVRAALAELSPDVQAALWAAYGPTPWGKIIDQAFGRGMALRVSKQLGDLAGVALLTRAVREGHAAWTEDLEGKRAAWRTPGGYLVTLCIGKTDGDKAKVQKVRREAEGLLEEAARHYQRARAQLAEQGEAPVLEETARARRAPERPRRERRPSFDPFAGVAA